jgi:flagellar hook-associated protein 2
MSTTSSIFTGSSAYSTDFQNLISRATAIASLPIQQLNTDKANLTAQSTALSSLDAKVQALQSAVDGISGALSGSTFDATVSDTTKLRVNLSDGAVEGSYKVDVVDAGAYATSMSKSNWIAPADAARVYRLSLGDQTYSVTPANNSAAAVAVAINSQYGDKVRATVVNVGSGAQSDYRISLQASALGDLKPALLTGPATPAALQTQQATGSDTRADSRTAGLWNDAAELTFQLSLNGQTHALTPADNTAQGVADAINGAYGDQVTAAVVNLGDELTPDYRVTLTASGPGNVQPDILADDGVNGPVSIQEQTATGSDTRAVSRTTVSWSADPGPALKYQLSLGEVKYTLAPASNTAAALVADINSKQGDKVTATLVDTVSGTTHDYRITITAVKPGDLKPDLIVSEVDLQQQQATGALAHYIVNNSGKDVASATRSVSIATGLGVTLLARDSGTPVNITVTRSTSALSDALTKFTDAYNAIVDDLDKQRGTAGGALAGQSLVTSLSQTLAGIGNYNSSSGLSVLANIGVELDKTGHLTFNSFKLLAADLSSSSAVTSFLGSTTSGFIKAASDALDSIESPVTGTLTSTETLLQAQIADVTASIDDHQAKVDDLTKRLQEQMAAADALIASMQQQYSYMSSMFSAMQSASDQYK